MRNYALRLERYGISYDRYRELTHFCRQYHALEENYREMIRKAAEEAGGEYAEKLRECICEGDLPYRYLDVPYSETQFKRMRRAFFKKLHELKK